MTRAAASHLFSFPRYSTSSTSNLSESRRLSMQLISGYNSIREPSSRCPGTCSRWLCRTTLLYATLLGSLIVLHHVRFIVQYLLVELQYFYL